LSYSDVSLNQRLFVTGDVSLNGNVVVAKDISILGRLSVYQYKQQNIINTTTTNYTFIVGEDMSLNNRLFVGEDVSLNQRLYVGGDTSMNGNLNVKNYIKVNRITETINNLTYVAGPTSAISVPFTTNATVYYITPTAATNFVLDFTSIPTDPNQTFVCTVLIYPSSAANICYCNAVKIGGVSKTLLCNGGIANVSTTSATFISQSFVFVNAGGSAPVAVLTNVVTYQ
jgi:hypothetical protein